MRTEGQPRPQGSTHRWADALLLLAAVAAMLWVGWRGWPHFLVDFGRELYVAWRLSSGDTLYVDVAYFNGPLSPYLNALAFWIFGVSVTTLFALNCAVMLGTLALLYRLLFRLGGRLNAVIGCLLFVVVFALADLTGLGNYNFLAPYSHEMTHGTILSLLMLASLFAHLRQPARGALEAAGLVLGLIFLTKAEFFVAALVAVLATIVLATWSRREGLSGFLGQLAVAASAGLIAPLVALLVLATVASPAVALRGLAGPWAYLFSSELASLPFYSKILGLTDLPASLERTLLWSGVLLVILAPPLAAALLSRPGSRARRPLALVAALWVVISTPFAWSRLGPSDLASPLPAALLLTVALFARGLIRDRARGRTDPRRMAVLVFALYSLVLLLKIFFSVQFHHYGFALALPAAMVAVQCLLREIPDWIERRGRYGPAFRLAGVAFLIPLMVGFLQISVAMYQRKTEVIGHGLDSFRATDDAVLIQQALARLGRRLAPEETLALLPEGVMLNYLLRRENPTPYINFLPPEFVMFGEEAILEAFRGRPPDVVVIVKRNTLEYGFTTLGEGYGEKFMAWVEDHYGLVDALHEPRLEPRDFARVIVLRQVLPEQPPAEE